MLNSANRFIVFQAYGQDAVLRECTFALLTFLHHHPQGIAGLEIWIYTDKPEAFRPYEAALPLRYRQIDAEDIKRWRGSIDFVHRVKIEVLRDFVKDHKGCVLYMDTDVCFLRDSTRIFEGIESGRRYMHVQESKLRDNANPIIEKLNAFLARNSPLKWGNRQHSIPQETAMWNAGVLGFSCSDAQLLDEVLRFTDDVHVQFHKHVVEQFAFSFIFQEAGPVYAACREILHYWSLKEMRLYLASFFDHFAGRPVEELARLSQIIQLHVPMQDRGSFYLNRSPIGKIRRVQWAPLIPDWAELERQMSD